MSRGLTEGTPSGDSRLLLVGEADLSHGALARRLELALARHGMHVTVQLVPEPNRVEARLIMFVPKLGALDLQPLRWKLRYSARARRLLQRESARVDVALVNTQSCALLSRGPMLRVPVVLSVDATGRQMMSLAYWRAPGRATRLAERPVEALERRAYRGVRTILAWTEWTARSLREDYDVPPERIRVLHFGVEVPATPASGPSTPADEGLRVLFVGNGVERKGLSTLIEASGLARSAIEVDVVTSDAVDDEPGLTVHRGLVSGSAALADLYASAHAFVLPTRADGVPWVVLEAMAAGLPVVAGAVGAVPELVGDAGLLIEPDDVAGLAAALDRLAADAALRVDLAARARRRARARYDQATQAPRVVEVLQEATGAR